MASGVREALDQPKHHERERERADAGGTAWVAAHDGNPHRVVEPARENDADHGGRAVSSRQRKRRGPLARPEQPGPAESLERLREQ